MIAFIIICVFVGIILTGVLTPVIMASNAQKIKQIKNKIAEFENGEFSEKERKSLKKELIEIKSKIVADEDAKSKASDLISLV